MSNLTIVKLGTDANGMPVKHEYSYRRVSDDAENAHSFEGVEGKYVKAGATFHNDVPDLDAYAADKVTHENAFSKGTVEISQEEFDKIQSDYLDEKEKSMSDKDNNGNGKK